MAIAFVLGARSQAAFAQQNNKATQPSASPKELKIGSVLFSGSLRARLENWNWFDTSAADSIYTFFVPRIHAAFLAREDHQ